MAVDTNQLIVSLSMQLLQQDLLTNTLFSGGQVGRDLRSMLLQDSAALKLTDPSSAALTGRIRSDAGMFRQASKNVSEAASITLQSESNVETLRQSLDRMKEIADGVADGTITAAAGQSEYNDLVTKIDGIIASTSYNGMKLFDSAGWAGDERITVSGTSGVPGTTGKVAIQAGDSSFNISLQDLSFIADRSFATLGSVNGLTMVGATDLADAAAAATTSSRVSSLSSYVSGIESMLEGRAADLASQASGLSAQASILDAAANTRAKTNESRSLEQLVLDYIVNNVGKIIDSST
ncbi:flagellin [Desulfovibrio mangrovi]|uniref:flagellin N-terminal helical domain-containing protein n=1 Tax=Desulfovibrio mangrovi TaxID=2976983 RepID=UPI00224787F6|nr:flagellin [Desulfovibrio mangrovi]UZP67083.1 flagellin [Desulfovibrio mangrovi]